MKAADKAFRAALDAYYAGHYTDAIAGFDKLLQVAPQHAQALQYRTLAAKARVRFGDVPVVPAPEPGSAPVLFWTVVGGGGALAAGLAVLLVVLVRRRRTPSVTLPPGPFFPGYSPIPAQGQAPWAEKVLVRETPAGGAAAPTVDLRTINGAVGGADRAAGSVRPVRHPPGRYGEVLLDLRYRPQLSTPKSQAGRAIPDRPWF